MMNEQVSKTNIKIIQLNVLSWNNTARRLWISLYIREKSPDIILLNSTSLVCTDHNKNNLTTIELENYNSYLTKQDVQFGSAILVKKNLYIVLFLIFHPLALQLKWSQPQVQWSFSQHTYHLE